MDSAHLKTRVICNPAASGGGYGPEELRQELDVMQGVDRLHNPHGCEKTWLLGEPEPS